MKTGILMNYFWEVIIHHQRAREAIWWGYAKAAPSENFDTTNVLNFKEIITFWKNIAYDY